MLFDPVWFGAGGVFVLCLMAAYAALRNWTRRGCAHPPHCTKPRHPATLARKNSQLCGATMLHDPETVWFGAVGVGLLCIAVIYVAVMSPWSDPRHVPFRE